MKISILFPPKEGKKYIEPKANFLLLSKPKTKVNNSNQVLWSSQFNLQSASNYSGHIQSSLLVVNNDEELPYAS